MNKKSVLNILLWLNLFFATLNIVSLVGGSRTPALTAVAASMNLLAVGMLLRAKSS